LKENSGVMGLWSRWWRGLGWCGVNFSDELWCWRMKVSVFSFLTLISCSGCRFYWSCLWKSVSENEIRNWL